MTLTTNETSNLEVHRIEMTATLVFDVVMPKTATEEDTRANAALAYQNAVDDCEGFSLDCSLPHCRVYVATADNLEPKGIEIADTMPFRLMKKGYQERLQEISF